MEVKEGGERKEHGQQYNEKYYLRNHLIATKRLICVEMKMREVDTHLENFPAVIWTGLQWRDPLLL